ncbi:hypothetical protein C1752_00470 [Acaryochloris thomasi RCC1774]|uniref:NACHT domain-containing protein n=1 Tax=Acaryochloris thomasi RCC1774 TaxID=1764569 RepID=A0A2W1K5L0_9CYAN|nr:NACHT domain-containing protein [Acaryochloris thomasi]PZD74997.1 hypothetical protein C1752_00470 [Acaryochloris thomasi RCC1774]
MNDLNLIATPEGIRRAEIALIEMQLTKTKLAERLGLTRPPISKFFNGKTIRNENFVTICKTLGLDWRIVCGLQQIETVTDQAAQAPKDEDSLEKIIQNIRDDIRPRITRNHGKIKVLNLEKPIDLDDIYISINILEKVTRRKQLEFIEIMRRKPYDEVNLTYENVEVMIRQPIYPDDVDRFSRGPIKEKHVPILDAVRDYKNLLVLGKPGSGKTTLLKYLAVQCIRAGIKSQCIPILITLKEFSEAKGQPSLLEYIRQDFLDKERKYLEKLLINGNILILLDGLDEVYVSDISRVTTEIKKFSEKYIENSCIVTCRIAAEEHNLNFIDIEIDDLEDPEIKAFATKWFCRNKSKINADDFLKQLKSNSQILELAKTPKLLALLCLIFEDLGKFPHDRSRLYRDAVKTLVKQEKREKNGSTLYTELSIGQKEKLFSYIAYVSFVEEKYFFDVDYAKKIIKKFLIESSVPNLDRLDIDRFMNYIQAQNGLIVERAHEVYSFSHLTFHEYFVSREIVESTHRELLLLNLSRKILESRWKEVILLVSEMIPEIDTFLLNIKHVIDNSISEDQDIQKFVKWIYKRASHESDLYKKAAIRAFYWGTVGYGCCYAEEIAHAFELNYSSFSNLDSILIFLLLRSKSLDTQGLWDLWAETNLFDYNRAAWSRELIQAIDVALSLLYDLDYSVWSALQKLRENLTEFESSDSDTVWDEWWQSNGSSWVSKLNVALTSYLEADIYGIHSGFNNAQTNSIIKYLEANAILVACLKKSSDTNSTVREEIENTLLLPIIEIKSYKSFKKKDIKQ